MDLLPEEIAAVREIAEEADHLIPGERSTPGWRERAFAINPPLDE